MLSPLLDGGEYSNAPAPAKQVWWHKWWVLFLYSYLSGVQSLIWMTFSSVPAASREFLSTDNSTMDLWLDWGPVAFCFMVFPATYLLAAKRTGLQLSIRSGFVMSTAAALIRCIPLLFTSDQRAGSLHGTMIGLIHFAQFLNGAVAPFATMSPSLLSLTWFPEGSRNTATAIANVSNALGRAIGFFLGPALVSSGADIPLLMLIEVAIVGVPALAALLFCPPYPTVPPSPAAAEDAARWDSGSAGGGAGGPAGIPDSFGSLQGGAGRLAALGDGDYGAGLLAGLEGHASSTAPWKGSAEAPTTRAAPSHCAGLRAAAREFCSAAASPSFLLVAASGGLTMAVFGAWSGVIPAALTDPAVGFSSDAAGAMGSFNTFAGIAGGVVAGAATDLPLLRRSLKTVVCLLAVASAALFAPIALALPPVSGWAGPLSLAGALGGSYPALLALCTAAGALRGATDPLFFELAAEAAHAVGAGAGPSGALLTLLYHLALCVALSMPAAALQAGVMPGMPVALLVGAALLLPARIAYTRRK